MHPNDVYVHPTGNPYLHSRQVTVIGLTFEIMLRQARYRPAKSRPYRHATILGQTSSHARDAHPDRPFSPTIHQSTQQSTRLLVSHPTAQKG